jgi:hypothetical protein
MPARAYVQDNFMSGGVQFAILLSQGGDASRVLTWQRPQVVQLEESTQAPDESWVVLPDDAARALYEALGRHYGGTGADVTALRRDYDAERKRVDGFIAHLTRGAE